MPYNPTPEEINELAGRLKPDQLLVLPFYHELENEVKNPDRVRIQTEYFWKKWAPRLGPTMTVLVITLRSYCYYNKLTKEKRDYCYPEQAILAQQVGVERKTILRELRDNPYAHYFIRREPQYRYDQELRKKVRTTDMYHVAMDDPILPEDEGKLVVLAAERILKRNLENKAFSPKSQFGTQVTPPVDNQRPKYQNGTYMAVPNWDSLTSTSKKYLRNVNVSNESSPKKQNPDDPRQELLVDDIIAITGDATSKSKMFFRFVARELSEEDVREIISQTRQANLEGRIMASPAKYFTSIAKHYLEMRKPKDFSS